MAPQGDAYHVDWIFLNNSNCHVANHRGWFTNLVDSKSHLVSGIIVLGIGDVELDVKTNKRLKGSKSHRKLILRDVLYAPELTCNILGGPIMKEFDGKWSGEFTRLVDKTTGGSAGSLDCANGLYKLLLVNQPLGKSSLEKNKAYYIEAMWPTTESLKWQVQKTMSIMSLTATTSKQHKVPKNIAKAPYTTAEKAWLKRAFGGEFKFLSSYGLNMFKEEHHKDNKDENQEQEHEGEEEDNQFLADLESDPTSHFADRFFSEGQLDFIQEHYRHSGSFLPTHGLKFYDDADCRKGVSMVRSMMLIKR